MFFENLCTAAEQVAILYVLVLVGFVCDKVGIFTEKTARATVDLLLYVITPCRLICSFLETNLTGDTFRDFFISLGVAFATHIIAILINLPFFRGKNDTSPVFKYASIYGNVGFMALPLAAAVLGDQGVFYCANGVIAFNVVTFTHGAKIMAGDEFKLNIKRLLLNPGVIPVAIGLPLFLLQIKLPSVLSEPLNMAGSLNSPLAMIIFGTYLSKANIKGLLLEKRIYLVALLKLIVLPLVCLGIYRLCGISGTLLAAASITAAVPSANNTFMFASKYGRDSELASGTVALVSLISIITLPAVIALAQTA